MISSIVDQLNPYNYFATMLLTEVKQSEEAGSYRRKITEKQLASRNSLVEGQKRKAIDDGRKAFEKFKGNTCDTREFAAAAKKCKPTAALNRLVEYGFVKMVRPSIGTIPAKWKWIGK